MRLISPRWLAVGLALLIWAMFSLSNKTSAGFDESSATSATSHNRTLGIVE
jgi:hypothetical protein